MKRTRNAPQRLIFFSLLATFTFSPGAYPASVFDDLSSLEKEAYVHFSAGVLISHMSYPVIKKYTHDRNRAMWYSFLLTTALGIAKEICDTRATGFSGGDLAAGVLGGATILVVAF